MLLLFFCCVHKYVNLQLSKKEKKRVDENVEEKEKLISEKGIFIAFELFN